MELFKVLRFAVVAVLVGGVLATAAGAATLSGKAAYDGEVPRFQPIKMDADPKCIEKNKEPALPEMLVLGEGKTMANVFVQVKSGYPQKEYPAPQEAVVIDQRGCRYVPHVVGLMAGQPLKFLNSDGILHNVHGMPKQNREFNMGMAPTLKEAQQVLNKPEPVFLVKCDVHGWMQAYVAVMSHPFFAATATDGKYSIANLPAGSYEVEAWHEKLGTQVQKITLAENDTKTLDFTFKKPSK